MLWLLINRQHSYLRKSVNVGDELRLDLNILLPNMIMNSFRHFIQIWQEAPVDEVQCLFLLLMYRSLGEILLEHPSLAPPSITIWHKTKEYPEVRSIEIKSEASEVASQDQDVHLYKHW